MVIRETAMSAPSAAARPPAHALRLRELLYRYWFFGWLFEDVNRPTLLERAAAWRHNQSQARWLPVYLKRWAVLTVLSFLVDALLEHGLQAQMWSAVLYVQAVLGMAYNTVTTVVMLGLKILPGPF
jgi:hypothetical protein